MLQNNEGDDLKLSVDGKFTFAAALADGLAYEVSVRTQPLWQFCTVTQGSGKASAAVIDVAVACSAAAAQVSTFAGSGTIGSVNGNGTAASFYLPYSVVVDKNGSLLVSDTATNLVRKISPAGDVTTFAGGSSGTSQDGNGTAASFSGLSGLALDPTGNAYAAEFGGNRIRKITPAADVTTLAGNGSIGSLDGHGSSATFNTPSSVATDVDGNIYVLEFIGAVVRKVTPAGNVTTLAGSGIAGFADGTGAAVSFGQAYGIATDAVGNVYVADSSNNRIRKITPGGVVTTLAGSGQIGATDGAGSSASFSMPGGLTVDSDGNVYVADTGNSLLRKITPAGVVSTLAGQPGVLGAQNGIGAAATFKQPYGVTVDAVGNLYVADTFGNLIRKITPIPAP
ncbi:NHL repeat-containing protein [Variovorax saccharolyticus]|uniref:NHL repeat-containing protein n=1 Tax=Variovorax saccharolyticus TaxID=3053516 RepID=UPI002574A73F|nr:NHL repeat-containing protein [Variovorax sp. J22R187]MDM0021918.1 NHL repeat-containing protein [Variovorax sp. J22R187]